MGTDSPPEIRSLVRDLLDCGRITPGELHSPSFEIESPTSRNRLVLIRTAARTIAIKHHLSRAARAREVSALHGVARAETALRIPELIRTDDTACVTQTEPGLQSLPAHRSAREPSITLARLVARMIASLHAIPVPADLPPGRTTMNPSEVGTWIIDSPPGPREVIREIQLSAAPAGIRDLLDRLDGDDPVFSHGDLRTGNILRDQRGCLWLIDWETASSDSRWRDIGAALALFVELAVGRGKGPPRPVVLRALTGEYALRAGVDIEWPTVIQCAGLQLLQSTVERAHHAWPLPSSTRALMTIGFLFLRRPYEGAAHLGLVE